MLIKLKQLRNLNMKCRSKKGAIKYKTKIRNLYLTEVKVAQLKPKCRKILPCRKYNQWKITYEIIKHVKQYFFKKLKILEAMIYAKYRLLENSLTNLLKFFIAEIICCPEIKIEGKY